MLWLLLNVPLIVLFFALWVGVPLWLVVKHPDAGPIPAGAPAVTRLPVRRHSDDDHRRAA
jgi:hypothetical protein